MKSLNRASLDVWTEYLRDTQKREVSEKILILDSSDKLTPTQEEELEVLLKLETRFLAETELIVDEHKAYIKKLNFYKSKLEHDERLLAIYIERVVDKLNDGEYLSEEDVKNIYISLMEEDMDVNGHKELNTHFEELLANAENADVCLNPDCIYCTPVSTEEVVEAQKDLEAQGFFDEGRGHTEDLTSLMVTVHRLQDELDFFKENFEIDDDGNFGGIGGFIIDDDDDDDE